MEKKIKVLLHIMALVLLLLLQLVNADSVCEDYRNTNVSSNHGRISCDGNTVQKAFLGFYHMKDITERNFKVLSYDGN